MIKISKIFDRLVNYFSEEVRHPLAIKYLRIGVYVVTICYTVFMANDAKSFWGETSLIGLYDFIGGPVNTLLRLLLIESISHFYWFFILLNVIACVVGITGNWQRIMAFLVYFSSINLYVGSTAFLTTNAGMNLIFLTPFYLIFMNETPKSTGVYLKLNNVLTNIGFWAVRIQLTIVYFVAATYKFLGETWYKGHAFYYSLSVEEFSTAWVREYLLNYDFLMISGNYFGWAYQLLFPILVWFRKIRGYFLIAGVFFHLCIAFMMELPDFGFAMIAVYAVFVDEEKYQRIINFFQKLKPQTLSKLNQR